MWEAAAACHPAGITVMMGAPNLRRGGSHSGNIAAAVHGLLQALSSDYMPGSLLLAAFRLPWLRADIVRVALAGDQPVVRQVWRGGQRRTCGQG